MDGISLGAVLIIVGVVGLWVTVGISLVRKHRERSRLQSRAAVAQNGSLTVHEWLQLASGVGRVMLNAMNEPDVKEDKSQVQCMPKADEPRRLIDRGGRQ